MVVVHETSPSRVLLGAGARHAVPEELTRLGADRVLVVATRSAGTTADELVAALGERAVARFDGAVVHTPVEVTEQALSAVADAEADAVVTIGGGSAVGLGKALVARTGLPHLTMPTTYAGSEVTPVLGETKDGVKQTRRDPALLPGTVVYDVDLTLTMPVDLTLTSAVNALAHAVEALWAATSTPVSDALATESARLLLGALPVVLEAPRDAAGREALQHGAWLAGTCLATVPMGLHHQLAHALGGTFDLPHAPLHTVLLAHVVRHNLPFAPAADERLTAISGGDPAAAIAALAASYDGPRRLRDLGVPDDGLAEVADRVAAAPYPNPGPVDAPAVLALLHDAW
ncbi:iron-containing alcohol dehydrogenase [Pimelobacter simplex]|uniref:Alcohol dehydrogenase n=1 Tax=Nocardioides simplex TaxID=2045 RepID=A0A0A1DFT1_NOCSI|nr:maleylacetate reductase [Pimelobacter simplex]AIY16119.1 Alcohol dehydrogenase [Pimelobacter simplex]MCG8151162.1 iron-containing alcohol dehydrogenase [Pimelobacter simplex]GEB12211.1 maleylacetate reductase [Pimelobacter simplex]SFM98176.1 Alcohol dehydrogenase, class IV [Pimelobacter simplex]